MNTANSLREFEYLFEGKVSASRVEADRSANSFCAEEAALARNCPDLLNVVPPKYPAAESSSSGRTLLWSSEAGCTDRPRIAS